MRRKSKEDRLSSLEDDRRHPDPSPSVGAPPVGGSLRSSQSQTPDDEDSAEARRFSCKRHGSGRSRGQARGGEVSPRSPEEVAKPAAAAQSVAAPPFLLSIKKSGAAPRKGSGGNGTSGLPPPPQPPQVFHHFKHYDHKDQGDLRTGPPSEVDGPPAPLPVPLPPPLPKRGDTCCRPRSASTGNHLSDVDAESTAEYHSTSTFPHRREGRASSSRRHHTLDGYGRTGGYSEHRSSNRYVDDHEEYFQGRHGGPAPGGGASGIASSHSVSSKSEKSSRSSQSPSVENLRHGKSFLYFSQDRLGKFRVPLTP